jgi:hypothetical protein
MPLFRKRKELRRIVLALTNSAKAASVTPPIGPGAKPYSVMKC